MIIINRMFSGSYLKDKIGHEWINLFQADDDNNYLYLNAKGNFDGKFDSKKKWSDIFEEDKTKGIGNYMLMVRRFDKGVLQVIAKAEIESIATKDNVETDCVSNPKKVYVGDKVQYNGVTLKDIFSNNAPKLGQSTDPNQQQVTFIAKQESVKLVKEMVLLTTDDKKDGCLCLSGKVKRKEGKTNDSFEFSSSSLRQFVLKSDMPEIYDQIKEIIDNIKLWGSSPVKIDSSSFSLHPTTLFEVIHKENDELMYSDMLKFYLEDEDFAKYFIKEVLKLDEDEYVERVDREEFNIDLLIRTNKRLIVIENKIHSGINGKDKDLKTQFDDAKKALEIVGPQKNPISNPVTPSQLTKYYIYAELLKQNDKPNSYFILCPEYKKNEIMLEKVYSSFPVYKIVTYKTLYDEMLKYNGWINFSPDRNRYWSEFISVMERHTKGSAFDYELEQMRLKFLQATQMKK